VALARALVREPQLLLLDEPFAALDALTRLRMHELVLALWRAHGCAVLMVTHDVDEAVALADRILVLDGGRIAAQERITHCARRARRLPLKEKLLGILGGHTDARTDHVIPFPHASGLRPTGQGTGVRTSGPRNFGMTTATLAPAPAPVPPPAARCGGIAPARLRHQPGRTRQRHAQRGGNPETGPSCWRG
jgi:energy-coupling factor transporter ATP-binding protein EcfA2